MLALLLAAALPLAAAPDAPPTIAPEEASRYVGKEVIVQGTISQIALTVNLTTHINMGGRYPDHVFTATILRAKQPLFAGVKDLEGRLAQVQGVVNLYRGKPEIMLTDPNQLRAVEAGQPAAPPARTTAAAPGISDPRFDAQGADFSSWVAHFKQAVHRQWRLPDAVAAGARGRVDFDFVVERDGSRSAIRMRRSSGTTSLDRAAANALADSQLLPLPPEFPGANLMMQVSFVYDEPAS
jgi:TonB family protein